MKEKILETLSILRPALRQTQAPCFLIGASALLLTGIKLEQTLDIDLLTSASDGDLLKRLWADKKIEYTPAGGQKFRSNFARFDFGTLDVEVMGDLEVF